MRRFALILIVVIGLAPVVWTQPAVLAQDDEVADAVAELVDEVAALREEVGLLKDHVATFEERVARLEGAAASNGDDMAGGDDVPGAENLAGTWVDSIRSAYALCGDFACASKSDWWDLELGADGTYRWGEAPYGTGNYEVFGGGGSAALDIVNLDVVLVGDGGLRCTLHYDGYNHTMWVDVPDCPGLFAEPNTGGAPLELNSGYVSFLPAH